MQAVKLGYDIADEQIQKGQDIARRLRGASVRSGAGDVGELVDQGLRLAKQMAVLFVEWSETTSKAPSLLRAAAAEAGKAGGVCGGSGDGGDTPSQRRDITAKETAAVMVPVMVASVRPTRVTVVLSAPLSTRPDVYPLFRAPPKQEALHGVKFSEHAPYVLEVTVDAWQAAGAYRGCAVEPGTGKVLGTIVVEVNAEPA